LVEPIVIHDSFRLIMVASVDRFGWTIRLGMELGIELGIELEIGLEDSDRITARESERESESENEREKWSAPIRVYVGILLCFHEETNWTTDRGTENSTRIKTKVLLIIHLALISAFPSPPLAAAAAASVYHVATHRIVS
jgi:hypothetical protein